MSGTGVNYQDLLPHPEKTDPEFEEVKHGLQDGPTASHALATADHEDKGVAQKPHDAEVKDLGWKEPAPMIPSPLVGGLNNEELWLLVRRFNKQIYYVKETTAPVPGNLDLNVADEDEFSPDKLRSILERLYMTVIIGLIGFGKHVVRLRSWRETRRTSAFAITYFLAWWFDLLVPVLSVTLITLTFHPPSRPVLFPPAPIALVSSTGGVQTPKAGVLGSHDSATGAPENHKGEAVEAEASNFVNSIAHVALSSAAGKHPMEEPASGEGAPHDAVPDPSALALGTADARVAAAGEDPTAVQDKTKVPMQAAMWAKMRPTMHILGDVADTWERFGNALSPTPPFPQEVPRLRLTALVVPLLAASMFITSYMLVKGTTFALGLAFFGDPLTSRTLAFLNRTFPHWQKLLEVRNTILKGVPTNAQLTLTLLRTGEANKAPIPPPPNASEPPPDEAADLEDSVQSTGADTPLGATEAEIAAAANAQDSATAHDTGTADVAASKESRHGRKGSRILGFLKTSVRGTVSTAIATNTAKAKAGSSAAKNRLGVVVSPASVNLSGPVDFKARYHGKKGTVYIVTKATIPCIAFTTSTTLERIGNEEREDLHPIWSIAVADIREVRKIGGYGWKARLVVGWALDRQIADGLEITDRRGGVWRVTAMPLRDELFNRIVAMGGQKWESW